MLQIDMPMDLTFSGVQPITFQPKPEFVSNHQFSSDQDNPINIGLRDLKDLMSKYQTCVLTSDTARVSSGGVQQFLNRLVKKKETTSDFERPGCEIEQEESAQMDEAVLLNSTVSGQNTLRFRFRLVR